MPILSEDLNTYCRNLLEEENPGYWKEHHITQYINLAVEFAFEFCHSAREDYKLKKGTITITSQNVTDKETFYVFPNSRTIFISSFHDQGKGVDYRPYTSSDRKLEHFKDFDLPGDGIRFFSPPSQAGSLTFWYKALPDRVKEPKSSIDLEDFYFTLLVEVVLFYARRRDENVQPEQDPMIRRLIQKTRAIITRMPGSMTRLGQVRWNT